MEPYRPLRFSEVFVGRAEEMQRLRYAAEEAADGHGCVLTVTGDPGIGKSRILETFAEKISEDALVLHGRCPYSEGAPPYFLWAEIIGGYVRVTDLDLLRSVIGEYSSVIAEAVESVRDALCETQVPVPLEHPGSARFRFFQAVAAVLKRAAEKRTLVLILHDLHWIDASSAALLEYLIGEIEKTPVLLVMSYRDRQVGENHPLRLALAEMARVERHDHLALKEFTPSEVMEFLAEVVPASVSEENADLIHRTTEGVPLFVRELTQMLHAGGHLTESSVVSGLPSDIPTSVKDLVGGWLGQLTLRIVDTVAVASVIGMDFEVDTVAACCAEPPEQVMEFMEEAVAMNLLDPGQPGQFRFSHSLVRESILANLSPPRLAQIHAQIAEGLVRYYGDAANRHAGQLAHHFGGAGSLAGTDRYVHFTLIAGEQAISQHAYEGAIDLFQRALEAVDVDDMTRSQLLFGLGRAKVALNEREEAVDLMTKAFDLFVQAGDVGNAVAAAEYPMVISFRKSGVAHLSQRALALVEPESLEAGRLECQFGLALAQEERKYIEARQACKRALKTAKARGDAPLEARSLLLAAFIEREEQNLDQCIVQSCEALKIGTAIPDLLRVTVAHHLAQDALLAAGDFRRGRSHAINGLSAAERLQDRYWLILAYGANQRYLIANGEWLGARELCDKGLELGPNDPFLLVNRARLEYETGNSDAGEIYLNRYIECLTLDLAAPPDRATYQNASAASVLPLIYRIVNTNEWLDLAESAARALLASPNVSPEWRFRAIACQGLVATAKEDSIEAKRWYEQLTQVMNPDPESTVVFCRASLTFVQAQLARLAYTAGDVDHALTHLEKAEKDCRAAVNEPELAWICYDYANVIIAENLVSKAEHALALINEGASIADRHKMLPLGEMMAKLKKRWPSLKRLTPKECEVLHLLAQGKTDREIAEELFISVRTASNHVSNILPKIGCRNRQEAIIWALKHGFGGGRGAV